MSKYIIETNHLTKQYGTQKSVADLNIHVEKGKIYGLLGRNGAGKTTTMKMLLGLAQPTSGEITIWGKPLKGNEKKIWRVAARALHGALPAAVGGVRGGWGCVPPVRPDCFRD